MISFFRIFEAVAALWAVTVPGSAYAKQGIVDLRIDPSPPKAVKVVVQAKALDGRGEPWSQTTEVGAAAVEVRLPEGAWSVQAEAPGFWSPTVLIDGSARAELRLRRKGSVAGRIVSPSSSKVFLRLEREVGGPATPTSDLFPCSIDPNQVFACEAPAGPWAFSLRVRGHATRYFFGKALEPGAVMELGENRFEPGASLAGFVSAERKGWTPAAAKISLRLKVAGTKPLRGELKPNGFFQFTNLDAGEYLVFATQADLATDGRTVKIIADVEAFLDAPLRLTEPVNLVLTISPSVAPDGKPWIAEILEVQGNGPPTPGGEAAVLQGRLVWRLGTGRRYLVWIKTSDGQRVLADEQGSFLAEGATVSRHIEVSLESAKGVVLLADKPLKAQITFGVRSNISIHMASGEDGRFAGFLPHLGKWSVHVSSDDPKVSRDLNVDALRGADGTALVEIRLDDISLHGELVDENLKLFDPRTIVHYRGPATTTETGHVEIIGGRFTIHGLSAGEYWVHGEGPGRLSEDVKTTLSADTESDPVQLVMKKKKELRVRIVGPAGRGLPGTPVLVLASLENIGLGAIMRSTDAEGLITWGVPQSESEHCIAAYGGMQGLATRIVSVSVDRETTVDLPSVGGTIEVSGKGSGIEERGFLLTGGCSVQTRLIERFGNRNQIPTLAPGQYSLCPTRTGPGCVGGLLSPMGTLKLNLNESAPQGK